MELLGRRFDLLTGKAIQADLSDLQVKVTKFKPSLQSEPSETTGRQSLKKMLEQAKIKAKKGEGRLPKYLAPVAPDQSARRQFSFSRLSGALHASAPPGIVAVKELDEFPEITLDPLGLGTLVHAVLAEVNFANLEILPRSFVAMLPCISHMETVPIFV